MSETNKLVENVILEASRAVIKRLKREDFLYTVEAANTLWDVYKFNVSSKNGQIAIALVEGKVLVGAFLEGTHNKEYITHYIESAKGGLN